MGDRSPKDKQKKQKQHDKQVSDMNQARNAKQQQLNRANQQPGNNPQDQQKKAS